MSKRKPNNQRARVERFSRSVLRQFRVAVVNIDPAGRQGLIDYKTFKNIPPSPLVADAICDISHAWVVYLAGFCQSPSGEQYIKAVEVAPAGVYRSETLADVIEDNYRALLATCNPNHLVGSGWIANPSGVSLDEDHAAKIFDACGAWSTAAHRECA